MSGDGARQGCEPEKLLAALLNPSRPGKAALPREPGAVHELVAQAARHRVGPLLARILECSGELESLPEAALAALRRQVLDATFARARLADAAGAALDALAAAGIPVVLLKGAALGELTYAKPAERPMTDVDLLVPPGSLDEALTCLETSGFGLPSAEAIAFWKESFYNVPATTREGVEAGVEIHWSIAQAERYAVDVDGLFERARPLVYEGREVLALGPADLLLHQALHHSYHFFEPKLIWLHDLALLHVQGPPVEEALERAAQWGMRTALALSVAQLEKVYPGCAARGLANLVESTPRARRILSRKGSSHPIELIAGWEQRRTQLLLAFAMLDSAGQRVRALSSWARRTVRHGDRAGHDKLGRD